MRLFPPSLALIVLACWIPKAHADAHTSTAAAARMQALKKEIREELKREISTELRESLKAEIKSELAAESAMTGGAVEDDAWAEEEWKWEEPVKPEINFLEFDGYFRFRYDFFHNLDLDTYFRQDSDNLPGGKQENGPFSAGRAPPVPICNTNEACAKARGVGDSMSTANMRLRVEPIFNVYEDVKIKMQIDILDNVVLGSTPSGFPTNDEVPLLGFSQGQVPPSDGRNSLGDSIRFKRVWAEVMTPLGQIRAGRMPSHFGMGILANGGHGVDSDFGDTNDRIMFATKLFGHYVGPAFDWTVSGPTSAVKGYYDGQPWDRETRDNVNQYILAIAKRDTEQEVKEKLENDEVVVNYGLYGVYREQAFASGTYYHQPGADPAASQADSNMNELVVRDMQLGAGSVWFKLLYEKLLIEAEIAMIGGTVGNTALTGGITASSASVDLLMFGGALKFEYKLLDDALTIRFLGAVASGDPEPGWGIQPLQTSPAPGSWDGGQNADGKIENFRFDPAFDVDLILWRQLVGQLTDAIVLRPGIQYDITEGLGGRLDIVYSRAMWASSTPSASFGTTTETGVMDVLATRTEDANLGIEFDAKLYYISEDGFNVWLQYGLLVPFDGLDRKKLLNTPEDRDVMEAAIAQTIQVMMAVTY